MTAQPNAARAYAALDRFLRPLMSRADETPATPPRRDPALTGAALAYAALDHIQANPAEYDRLVWIARPAPGAPIVAGFDGRVCLLAGDVPDFDPHGPNGPHATARVLVDGGRRTVRARACELLGLDVTARQPILVPMPADDLAALVAEIFGPRPAHCGYTLPHPAHDWVMLANDERPDDQPARCDGVAGGAS